MIDPDEAFMAEGACVGKGPALFFGPYGEPELDRRRREHAAKAVCAECPVIDDCLTFARRTRQEFGVWGGLTEAELAERTGRRNYRVYNNELRQRKKRRDAGIARPDRRAQR